MKEGSYDQSRPVVPKAISGSGNKKEAIRSRIKRRGPICKSRTKTAVVVPEPSEEEDDVDLGLELGKGRSFGDGECMWLSSDASSPLPFFSNEYRLSSTSLHESVDEWLVYWLSTLADSYLYLDKARDLSESSISSCGKCLTSDDGSLTPFSTISGSGCSSCSSSQISDLDRMSFLAHLVNLDGEDSMWSSDADLELDCFESSFPSPTTCRSSLGSGQLLAASCSSVSTPDRVADEQLQHDASSKEAIFEAEELQGFSVDEPLFWPFERKLDWTFEETWKCFTMSPRKSISIPATPASTSSNSVEPDFHTANSDSKNRHSSRASKTCSYPSRLRKSTRSAIDTEDEATHDKALSSEINCVERNLQEDGLASKPELSIETLVGLGEFDGHEGVDSEFNEDVFSLDD